MTLVMLVHGPPHREEQGSDPVHPPPLSWSLPQRLSEVNTLERRFSKFPVHQNLLESLLENADSSAATPQNSASPPPPFREPPPKPGQTTAVESAANFPAWAPTPPLAYKAPASVAFLLFWLCMFGFKNVTLGKLPLYPPSFSMTLSSCSSVLSSNVTSSKRPSLTTPSKVRLYPLFIIMLRCISQLMLLSGIISFVYMFMGLLSIFMKAETLQALFPTESLVPSTVPGYVTSGWVLNE